MTDYVAYHDERVMTLEVLLLAYLIGGFIGSVTWSKLVDELTMREALKKAPGPAVITAITMTVIYYFSIWASHLQFTGGQ